MLTTLRRKIFGDLRMHHGRFLAVWVVVVMGAAFYGAFYPAGASTYNAYDQLHYMDFQACFDPASDSIVDQIREIEGVTAAEGRLVVESGIQLDPERKSLTTLRLLTVPNDGQPTVNFNDIPAGRDLQSDDEILLLKRFADYHGLRPGDEISLWINGEKHKFTVAGLASNPEYLVSGSSRESPFPAPSAFGVGWVRYGTLAGILGADGMINDVVISLGVSSAVDSTALRARVKAELEQTLHRHDNLILREREETASGGVVQANINGNFQIMAMFSGLFLVVALVVTFILLRQFVGSERQRIGTLRALGVSGGLVGSVLGYFASFTVVYPFVDAVAGDYLPGFANAPQFPFILLGFGIVVVDTTLAGAYPAWTESGTLPGIASAQAALLGLVTAQSATQTFDTLAFVLDETDPYITLTMLEGAPAFSSAEGVWIGHNLAAWPRPASDLAKIPGVISVEDYPAYVRDVNNYLSFWRINSWAFAIFGALLTLAVILNTVNARLQEQQADLAILRSLGIARREIIVSVLTEILILSALGVAVGIPLGREVGFQMAHSVDMDFYGLVALYYPHSFPLAIVAVLLIVFLAAIPGLRSAFKVDLGQVSKGQSM